MNSTTQSIDQAYVTALGRLGALRHVNAGRTLVADQLEAWYEGSELVLARATFEGRDRSTAIDFFYSDTRAKLAVERDANSNEKRTYLTSSSESVGDATSLASIATEVRATLRDYGEGKDVRPPAQE